ncbi:latent-transforming growth factor beta-binding protein 2-like [Mangifera indica]|uniref:latent-transforming growth factor beta-binding protein 2-like n=1 Tax=Mangifera indica TaxID=29780 RepID=UPI001CFA6C41|nr:latent-transforming growth factor beta-binding protein 2-like [Mangifera indica]
MESFTLNHSPLIISLNLLLLSLFIFNLSVPAVAESCADVNCGQGTCKDSNSSLLGFECDCNTGWKKLQIGPLAFPSCVLPNCSIDLQCNNASSPPSSLPQLNDASSPLQSLPQLNVCLLVWCGKGTCVANGTGYSCQCSQGASNLFNNSTLACLESCSFGADCLALGLGLPPSPPPTDLPRAPPIKSESHQEIGAPPASNRARNLRALTMMLLATTIMALF